jgi:type VI secretion system secreted protein Hcp
MPIYMKYDKIAGDVTAKGHEKWISIQSFQWGVGRGVSTPTGAAKNRESSAPSISEVTVSKTQDVSTIPLLTEFYQGHGKEVKFDFCSTEKNELRTYMTYTLTDVMISGYSTSSGGDRPSESLSLNFTKVMTKVITTDSAGKVAESPSITYSVSDAKTV